jgi:hypothetical protein
MSNAPSFASVPKVTSVSFSTANTNRDGTGTIQTGFAAGASGSMVSRITITATGTTTAGMVRVYHFDGASNFVVKEVPVDAITPSATVEAFRAQIEFNPPFFMPTGDGINFSTHNGEAFVAVVEGGDL